MYRRNGIAVKVGLSPLDNWLVVMADDSGVLKLKRYPKDQEQDAAETYNKWVESLRAGNVVSFRNAQLQAMRVLLGPLEF